ncbi:C2H2-like zinc finger protein isoform 1 [Hibiscus syriacus]|uniref:C2H2-like zinc finger protein isoform 1 n=1 Tax=Hibiscus syriacus TaxID=106335 RepID=A0A6A3CUT5_HIBSY|nr:C2H2-like zinc finger protein isoform 1 [Hibiscus syriacus]
MVGTTKKYLLIRAAARRKELFMQTCGLLILRLGNGTRFEGLSPPSDEHEYMVKKSGMPPSACAGFSMCVNEKRAMLFGGVVDMEMQGDVMMSLFLNELYGFQLDNHRWYPLELRKEQSNRVKSKKDSKQEPPGSDYNDKVNAIEVEASGIDDKDQISEYDEEAGDEENNIDAMSGNLVANMTIDDDRPTKSASKPQQSKSKTIFNYQDSVSPEASESEWVEASEDEVDEDEDEDEDDSDYEGESGSDGEETDDEAEGTNDGPRSLQMGDAVALIRGTGKNLRRKEKRARIEQIRPNLGLSDSQRTPTVP